MCTNLAIINYISFAYFSKFRLDFTLKKICSSEDITLCKYHMMTDGVYPILNEICSQLPCKLNFLAI